MKPVMQSEFGNGKGNCLSAAIASILELPLEQVPNFALYGGQFWQKFYQWLTAQNLGMCCAAHRPAGYHLYRVISPRGDFHHELVGHNGKPVHDPYPGGNCEGEFVMSNVLYPLDFAKPILQHLVDWEEVDLDAN